MERSPTQTDMRVGTRLGRYEVESRIAVGGMAEVWEARLTGSAGFEKRVALKTLLPELSQQPNVVRMFIHEAALAAAFAHPNVVQVYDFGQKDGHYFMAMEFVPGRTVRQMLHAVHTAGGRHFPLWALLELALQVCEGLEHIHDMQDAAGQRMGLLHRDISPENLMVSWTGGVKIIDFGVARVIEAAGSHPLPNGGKPRYTAPEHTLGLPLDVRADVFSLGVVLYACAAGRLPFRGKTPAEITDSVLHGRVTPLLERNPTLHPLLVRLIERAMATDRNARTPDVAALRSDLLDWAHAAGLDPSVRGLNRLVLALAKDEADVPVGMRAQASRLALAELMFHPGVSGVFPRPTAPQPVVTPPVQAESHPPPLPRTTPTTPATHTTGRRITMELSYPELGAWVTPVVEPARTRPTAPLPHVPVVRERTPVPPPPPPPPLEPTPVDPADPPAEAEALFERGLAAFRRGRWQDAVDTWERACALVPLHKGWAFNLAQARARLARAQGDDTDGQGGGR